MFSRASKNSIKIRLALSGASGAGKTFSALNIATHLGREIALIDTEHGSASKYADIFNFDTCALNNHHPAQYISAINAAEQAGYEVIVIDSLSHAWFAELEIAGKGFDGWKTARPLERKLIDAMLSSPAHIIATMRSKTEWIMEEYRASDNKMKSKPVKIGTAPVQSSGIEYEFDIAGELNHEHILSISKSRCPQISDRTFLNPGKEIADILLDWIKPVVSASNQSVVATPAQLPVPVKPVVKTPVVAIAPPPPEKGVYSDWKSLDDAFLWAVEHAGITRERAQEIYESTEPEIVTNKKGESREIKAPRFVNAIKNLTNVF